MKKVIVISVIVILAILGIGTTALYINQPNFLFSQVKTNSDHTSISYPGKNGVTALALLQQNTKAITSGTGKNAFITSINGVAANPSNQFWAFKINGKDSMVGAGSYITKNSDTITWTLTSF